jgi:hypothetical protein
VDVYHPRLNHIIDKGAKMAHDEFSGFDDDIDDLDFGELGVEDTSAPRTPVGRVKEVGKGVLTGLRDTDHKDIGNVLNKAFKTAGGSAADNVADTVGSFNESMREASNDLRKGITPLMTSLKRVSGNSILGRMLDKVDNKFGTTSTSASSLRTRNVYEEEKDSAANKVAEVLGQQKSDEQRRELLLKATEHNMSKSQLTALNKIAGYQQRHMDFLNNVTGKYYRKSLETQYRHLFMAKRQLEVSTKSFDLMSKQLESIVKNTGLPEYVKLKGSEAVKGEIRRKISSNLLQSAVKNNSWLESLKDKADTMRDNLKSNILNAAEAGDGMLGMGDMLESIPPEQLASMQIKDLIVMSVGKKLGNVVKKLDKGGKVNSILNDPSGYLSTMAEGTSSSKLKKFYTSLSDIFKPNTRFSADKALDSRDPNDIAHFDNRTKMAITRAIPGYLSRILAEVRGIRTGKKHETISFDYNSNRFITKGNLEKELINARMISSIEKHGSVSQARWFISGLEANDKDGVAKKYRKQILESILTRASKGDALYNTQMEKDGFFNQFGKDAGKMRQLFDNAEVMEDARSYATGILRFKDLIEDMIDNGHIEPLLNAGLITYNRKDDEYVLNEKKLVGKNI